MKRNIFGVFKFSVRTNKLSKIEKGHAYGSSDRDSKGEIRRGSTKKVESDGKRGQETIRLGVGANSLTFLNVPEYGKDFREEMSVPTALLGTGSQKTHFSGRNSLFLLGCRAGYFFLLIPVGKGRGTLAAGPKNKSIVLARLVHLFPTLHNIPPRG